jgi:putative ABC transport system substrate-binding protein
MQVQLHEASSAAAMDASFAAIAAGAPRAVLVLGDPLFTTYATRLAELALRHRLPCVGLTRPLAEAGMLASYGPSFEDAFRRAAYYVDRILKGAKPAELPVDRSLRFELVLNRRTARALNIEFPPSVVVRADQLID